MTTAAQRRRSSQPPPCPAVASRPRSSHRPRFQPPSCLPATSRPRSPPVPVPSLLAAMTTSALVSPPPRAPSLSPPSPSTDHCRRTTPGSVSLYVSMEGRASTSAPRVQLVLYHAGDESGIEMRALEGPLPLATRSSADPHAILQEDVVGTLDVGLYIALLKDGEVLDVAYLRWWQLGRGGRGGYGSTKEKNEDVVESSPLVARKRRWWRIF